MLFDGYSCSFLYGKWLLFFKYIDYDLVLILIDVPLPPSKRLSIADVYDSRGKPRVDILKQHFVSEGRIEDECALKIINDGTALLRAEKTMLDIEAPVTGNCTYYVIGFCIFYMF